MKKVIASNIILMITFEFINTRVGSYFFPCIQLLENINRLGTDICAPHRGFILNLWIDSLARKIQRQRKKYKIYNFKNLHWQKL